MTTPIRSTNYLSLDLEMAQPSGRIIQIGAVVGNLDTGEILEELNLIVNPHEPLSDFIVELTGITDAQCAQGAELSDAYKALLAMHAKHKCFPNPIVWGEGDTEALRSQLPLEHSRRLGYGSLDVKTLYQFRKIAQGATPQASLSKAIIKTGMRFKGQPHNALSDARNTFLLARELMRGLA